MGTHVSEQSWFSRIGNAFKGILVGGLLTVVSVPVLFWNEGRAVRTAKGLKEGAKVVVDIAPDTIDAANDGKFVHTSGMVETTDVLRDDQFGIEYNGIRLTRHVEMYQWDEDEDTETKKKMGGGTTKTTTYTYEKGWYSGLIDSSEFDEAQTHQNPTEVLFAAQTHLAKNVMLGQFRLPESLIGMIGGQDMLELNESNLPAGFEGRTTIRKDGPNGASRIYIFADDHDDHIAAHAVDLAEPVRPTDSTPPANPNRPELIDLERGPSGDAAENDAAQPQQFRSEQTEDVEPIEHDEPQIGDVRLWFTATPVQTVSLLSQQKGDSFEPYQTQYSTTINVLRNGVYSAAEMIAQEEAANKMLTWMLRAGGTLIMFIGLTLVLRPLVVLADVLPIAGSLVGFGTAIVAGLLTIAGSMTVIGIAWVFYRPVLGVSLLVIAAVAIFLIIKRGRGKRAGQPETLTHADLA